ncbi:hypothetical protein FJH38_22025 [Salmonella enterica]|nr:hypothetical protein [Salmonella enterica subsp. enterica serovar Kentucky]ECY1151083.1 hypothetical protein [Salmonella enterica subsp. enterica serovar Kentucky]ECZ2679178.1 hypothetical protein [Salmonella enterica subsp. enterica serovar Kentucky]
MDSVHHIWCPLFSQEFQDLPDGAETTLTNNERVHTQCFFGHVDLTINLYCLRILFPGHLQGACRAVS